MQKGTDLRIQDKYRREVAIKIRTGLRKAKKSRIFAALKPNNNVRIIQNIFPDLPPTRKGHPMQASPSGTLLQGR